MRARLKDPTPGGQVEYATVPAAEVIERTRQALESHGITTFVTESLEQAKARVLELIPEGVTVASGPSVTVDELGLAHALAGPGRYDRRQVMARLMARDHVAQSDIVRKYLGSADIAIGSANAVTEDGNLLIGSMTGSQLGPYVGSAADVILIVGAQKIVKDVNAGLRRLREYVLPLESERIRSASGTADTALNSVLIVMSGRFITGHFTVVLVKQAVGY